MAAETQINQPGILWGGAKDLLKWRKALGLGQVELADAAKVSHQLISFIETETQTFTEAAKSKLWRAIIRLGYKRAKKRGGRYLGEWAGALAATDQFQQKKNAERKARFEELQGQWVTQKFFNIFALPGQPPQPTLPAIEAEQQRIIEDDKSRLELSKLMSEQAAELAPRLEKNIRAEFCKNPAGYFPHYLALIEWREKVIDLEARGELVPRSAVEAKDRRIAELEQELAHERENKAGAPIDYDALAKEQGGVTITPDADPKGDADA